MGVVKYQQRVAAWIACLAVLLASLAPSISHILAAAGLSDASVWASYAPYARNAPNVFSRAMVAEQLEDPPCHASASGVADDFAGTQDSHAHEHAMAEAGPLPPKSPAPHSPGLHFVHCPFCFTHAGTFGLAPVALVVIPASIGIAVLPLLFHQSPRPLFSWLTTQPRGPPLFS